MPLFDFVCVDYGKASEVLVRADERPVCPDYGSARLEKQFPVVAVKGLKSDHVHTNACGCGKPRSGCGAG